MIKYRLVLAQVTTRTSQHYNFHAGGKHIDSGQTLGKQ
jgi:hypothetical protein